MELFSIRIQRTFQLVSTGMENMETPDPFFHRCGQFETEHFFRVYGRAYRKRTQRTEEGIRAAEAGAAFRHRCGQDTH